MGDTTYTCGSKKVEREKTGKTYYHAHHLTHTHTLPHIQAFVHRRKAVGQMYDDCFATLMGLPNPPEIKNVQVLKTWVKKFLQKQIEGFSIRYSVTRVVLHMF